MLLQGAAHASITCFQADSSRKPEILEHAKTDKGEQGNQDKKEQVYGTEILKFHCFNKQ